MNLFLMILAAVVAAVVLAYVVVKFVPLKMRWLVSIILLVLAGYFSYLIYDGVMEPINFNKEKKVRYAKVIKNLKIIRDAEVKYNQVYGNYTTNKDTLIAFIEKGELALTQTSSVEKKVHTGGGIYKTVSARKVDTVGYEKVSKYFSNVDFKNMFKVPGTDKEFTIETGSIEKVAGFMVPVFQAKVDKASVLKGMSPMLVKLELEAMETDQIKGSDIAIGSLNEVSTGGNWPPFYDSKDEKVEKK